MKLDLNEIAHSIGMHYTYEVDEDDSELKDSGIALDGRVRGRIDFANTGNLLIARGRLKANVAVECVRCLTTCYEHQEVEVQEQFSILHHGRDDFSVGDDPDLEEEDSDVIAARDLYHEGMLDLTELIRQNLLVALSLAPLCKQDCAGLCPHCGKNLNEGPCACQETEEEGEQVPQWRKALQDLQND